MAANQEGHEPHDRHTRPWGGGGPNLQGRATGEAAGDALAKCGSEPPGGCGNSGGAVGWLAALALGSCACGVPACCAAPPAARAAHEQVLAMWALALEAIPTACIRASALVGSVQILSGLRRQKLRPCEGGWEGRGVWKFIFLGLRLTRSRTWGPSCLITACAVLWILAASALLGDGRRKSKELGSKTPCRWRISMSMSI